MYDKHPNQEPLWVYPPENDEWLRTIIKEFNIHPVTAQILISRGFNTLKEINNYLYAKLPNLFDPNLFRDMSCAVDRIYKAIKNKEGILIYGDNDVDGMTSAALLTEFFKKLGCNVSFYIPNSNTQKKCVFTESIDIAKKRNCSLIITVDCGITNFKEIDEIVKNDIDVIITDHHEPTSKLPKCIAILNPKVPNSAYPNRDIIGVGVAFKLAHAVTNFMTEKGDIKRSFIDLKHYLDLVALGTISDMGSLLSENRILVRYGLNQLRKTKRMGLIKLFQLCDLNTSKLSPVDIASKIAPRLNSLGRIADPEKGVELLLIKKEEEAEALARQLELYNTERQKIERVASEDIDQYLQSHPKVLDEKGIVLYSDKWHPGIIPIITARLTKLYNRPTMLISIENGIGKGSIRTIPEFPLLNILKDNEKILLNFGGHDFAAGFVIEEKNIPILKKNFITAANKLLKDPDVLYKLYLDAEINFNDLTFDFMESLNLLEPFGNENPSPLLYCDVNQTWPPKVVGKSHLKLYLEQHDRMLEGIGFGMADRKNHLRKGNTMLRIAFTPHVNTFLNKTSIQLQIRDIKILEPPGKKKAPGK
jgi:single-stranded-DNA-specific exonuclease